MISKMYQKILVVLFLSILLITLFYFVNRSYQDHFLKEALSQQVFDHKTDFYVAETAQKSFYKICSDKKDFLGIATLFKTQYEGKILEGYVFFNAHLKLENYFFFKDLHANFLYEEGYYQALKKHLVNVIIDTLNEEQDEPMVEESELNRRHLLSEDDSIRSRELESIEKTKALLLSKARDLSLVSNYGCN